MPAGNPTDDKPAALRVWHALNPRPREVTDASFTAGDPFFDARDLVQVKYEMLRRVRQSGEPVSRVAPAFGFSRPSFYQALQAFEAEGLPGLLPERPGPRHARKLTPAVVEFLEAALREEPTLTAGALAKRVYERFGLTVHPSSIGRSLARRGKKGRRTPP